MNSVSKVINSKSYKPILYLLITLFVIVCLGIYKNSRENFNDTMFESRKNRLQEDFQATTTTAAPTTTTAAAGATTTTAGATTTTAAPTTTTAAPTTTTAAASSCPIPGIGSGFNHIISNFSGATFNYKKFNDSSNPNSNLIVIYQRPIRAGEHTHVLAVNDTGNIVTQPEDQTNPQQRWKLTPIGSTQLFEVVSESSGTNKSLNHDGNFLSVKPTNSGYEGTKWKVREGEGSNDILSCSPSLNHEVAQASTTNTEDAYAVQLAELLSLIKKNHEVYMEQVGEQQTTSSVFGTGNPLRLKVNVLDNSESSVSGSGTESFQNTITSSGTNNILNLLEKYENNSSSNNYSVSPSIPKCKSVNLGDYISNRVGQCNCIVD